MKTSFILHLDSISVLSQLNDEQAGQLFKAIYEYQINKEVPQGLDFAIKMALFPFVKQFERDFYKYTKIVDRNIENGKKGGRPKKEPNKPNGLFNNPIKPKKADSDNDNVSDNVNEKVKKSIEERKADFKKSLSIYLDDFGKDLLNEFFKYWTEKNPRGVKFRFEKEKTFDVSRRLETWKANNEKWTNEKTNGIKIQSGVDQAVINKLKEIE